MKILTVIGARPQFIKAAALSRELAKHHDVEEIIVHTGQHFDPNMSEIFFTEMEIPKPNYNLGINSLSHAAMTGRMLEGIESILLKEKPDVLLVYGDTNSTIAGALAAKKIHIKVAHVEAGMRISNMDMPEEINRILTDRISDYLFCSTQIAVDNLMKEGFGNVACQVVKSGDVMQDSATFYAGISAKKSKVVKTIGLEKYALATLHRAENTDDIERLTAIIEALNYIHVNICPIVLPLHPRTKSKLENANLRLKVQTIDPVGYFDMIELIKHASLVVTDSGGLQKEAFFFKKNCVTMRDQTEWVELIEHGVNMLVGADKNKSIKGFEKMLNKTSDFSMNLYGNGKASANIINALKKDLKN